MNIAPRSGIHATVEQTAKGIKALPGAAVVIGMPAGAVSHLEKHVHNAVTSGNCARIGSHAPAQTGPAGPSAAIPPLVPQTAVSATNKHLNLIEFLTGTIGSANAVAAKPGPTLPGAVDENVLPQAV